MLNYVKLMNDVKDMVKTLHCCDFSYEEASGIAEDNIGFVPENLCKTDECYERNSAELERKLYLMYKEFEKAYKDRFLEKYNEMKVNCCE